MRCLVVQTAYLGDVILTLPLLRLLSDSPEVSWTGAVVTPTGAEFLEGQGATDGVILYDKRGADAGAGSLTRAVRRVGNARADVALIPHRSFRSALIPFLARLRRRVGFDVSGGRALLTDRVPYERSLHEVERVLALSRPLLSSRGSEGGAPTLSQDGHRYFRLRVPPGAAESLAGILSDAGSGEERPMVVVAPGSRWATKRWHTERFAGVVEQLGRRRGMVAAVVGTAEDREACQAVVAGMHTPAMDLSGRLSVGELVALVACSRLLLSNDSATAHIAAGLGVPVVAVFGPTVPAQGFAPYSALARVAESRTPCRPCGRHGGNRCRLGTLACMSDVRTTDVLRMAEALLSEGKGEDDCVARSS